MIIRRKRKLRLLHLTQDFNFSIQKLSDIARGDQVAPFFQFMPIDDDFQYFMLRVHQIQVFTILTRVSDITRSVSARRWEGHGFDARPKLRHS